MVSRQLSRSRPGNEVITPATLQSHYIQSGCARGYRPCATEPKHIILHVGPHKTGSTYLQKMLLENASYLAENGYYIPDQWFDPNLPGNHLTLYREIKSRKSDLVRAKFSEILVNIYPNIILSSEDFSLLDREDLTFLRDILVDCRVTVLFFVRRWSEMLRSNWQEAIRQGSILTFPDFAARFLVNIFGESTFNFALRLNAFSDAFVKTQSRLLHIQYSQSGDDI